ncbi:LysR family transcriptional regulator [Agreia pratensis]|uniref:DNA-binding transcriptional regulator, LysR family n=1 Tax=Agreia pratensis TaxID=150121 RepID=A0A1X7JQ00_9MICO|nr:LysR family transcriptional regulator [Agreia pratensis]MBF4635355.1 LysR family transcriptional regulator [Agreia pratensis]SMG30043.1 DNA-binding transcriptional regulator, LysR family [Agreia pratensis]
MDIDPTTLRWFSAVATELHFGRAALSLGIARTRLSKAVVDLEAQLGYPLFDREQPGTQLTDAGRSLLEAAPELIVAGDERAALAAEEAARPVPFRISFVPGVTITKWTTEWESRYPDIPLVVLPTPGDEAVSVLRESSVDVAFVRLPIDRDGLSAIRLYDEVPVVVVAKDNPLSTLEEVRLAELADEHLIQHPDEVDGWSDIATEMIEGTRPDLPEPASVEDALDLVAAGTGIVVLPHSVARLHARKDVVARPVLDLPETQIALCWLAGDPSDRIEEFIGIVRGRRATSSRAPAPAATPGQGSDEKTAKAEPKKARTGAKGAKGAKGGAKGAAAKTPRPLGTARKPRPSGGYRQKGR